MSRQSFFLAILVSLLVLTSCAAPATPATEPPTIPPTAVPASDPMPVVESFLAAHNEHDAATAVSMMTEDAMFALLVKVKRHQEAQPVIGKEEIQAYLESDAWNAITINGSDFQVDGDRVLFKCRILSNGQLIGSGTITANNACLIIVQHGLITFVGDQPEALLYLSE